MKDMGERVAQLETQTDGHHEWLESVARDIKEVNGKVGDILTVIAGSKGFLNGVVFTLAVLGGILGFICAKLWDHFINGGQHP